MNTSYESLQQDNKHLVGKELRHLMRPELLNRIDKVVIFNSLDKPEVSRILNLQIKELNDRLAGQKIAVELSTRAKSWLAEHGFDDKNGVRPLRRLIQDTIEAELAERLLAGDVKAGDVVNIGVKADKLNYKVNKE